MGRIKGRVITALPFSITMSPHTVVQVFGQKKTGGCYEGNLLKIPHFGAIQTKYMPVSWMRFLKYISIITVVLGISVLLGCSDWTDFSNRLMAEVSKGPGTIIRFGDLTDFDWETVYIYGPYHPLDEINRKHGTFLKGEYGLKHVPEGDCLYVFQRDGQTIQATYHPRYKGSCIDMGEMYDRANAVFKVQQEGPGSHPILKWAPHGLVQPDGRSAR